MIATAHVFHNLSALASPHTGGAPLVMTSMAAPQSVFFILRILHEGHTPAAEAASTEGQQQDTAITL
jgi:hypothetical protein